MVAIPAPLDSDGEDVAWALQTADALWKRNERLDAIVWLRRAAQAAGEADDDDRALQLARAAAELAEEEPPTQRRSSLPPRVPTAAQKHAGLLDPWDESEVPTMQRETALPAEAKPSPPPPPSIEAQEIFTSAPPISGLGVDLRSFQAFSTLPDEAREILTRTATVREAERDQEIVGFALAIVVEGSVDVAAAGHGARAARVEAGGVVRARGTIDHAVPLRLVAVSDKARVATWEEIACAEALRTCAWLDGELRAAGNRLQAEVGATGGALGRLDEQLRALVLAKLEARALQEREVFAQQGQAIPGLLVVGAGELEIVGTDRSLRAGEFLFPSEVLRAAPAPHTARAGRGGAIVLCADRAAAQELLVTCPPLLEIVAG